MSSNRPAPVITFPSEVQDPYVLEGPSNTILPVAEIYIPTPTISNQNITIPQPVTLPEALSVDTIVGPVSSVQTTSAASTTSSGSSTSTSVGSTILANTIAPIKPILSSMGISGGGGATKPTTTPTPAIATPVVKKDYTKYYLGIPIVLIGLFIGYKTLKK